MATKITKAMKYADIRAMLSGETCPNGSTKDELITFVDSEINLVTKKNSTERKPSANQTANEEHKTKILGYLMEQTEGVTCTEIQKGVPDFADFNNQKIAALMRQLSDSGKVRKSMVKGRALFSII